MIIPYLSSALHEEGQWKSPHDFNPDNFLNERGEFVKPDAFMPFSLGSTHIYLFLTLLQTVLYSYEAVFLCQC